MNDKRRDQVLLGVTGSGKTFTMAKVIETVNRPTLVLSHNKTLAAQLYQEFRTFFPGNSVEYFVSYYDYYQPEAYIPQSDTYIEKETSRNEEIDKMRLSASKALFERRDVIVVASVSCIYGLGSPESYYDMLAYVEIGDRQGMRALLSQLVEMQYERTNLDLSRGTFRVRGDVLEIHPAYEDVAVRIEYFGDEVEKITRTDPLRGTALQKVDRLALYPRTFYATPRETLERAISSIRIELDARLAELTAAGRLLEAQRLHQRTMFDLEMIKELGYCNGIENYSRHLSGRQPGEAPPTLIDYFPRDFLLVVDESHVTLPQVRGMYHGDRSRKEVLVEYGFRLPSALDNRPLTYQEFESRVHQIVYVSATPGPEELTKTGGEVVEQVIRPTGLLDPRIEVRPVKGQVDDLLAVVREAAARSQRVLVTTLTKRMAEELTNYFSEVGVRCRYLHSDIETLDRVAILTDFRRGVFDCLIGINLLREGLDLPEVAVVAILDADKEGFLRSETSLIQTAGRAARNLEGRVYFYADAETKSMRRAMDETLRRRKIQEALQRPPRDRARFDHQGSQLAARPHGEPGLLRPDVAAHEAGPAGRPVDRQTHHGAREVDEGGGEGARLRARRGNPRRAARTERAPDLPVVAGLLGLRLRCGLDGRRRLVRRRRMREQEPSRGLGREVAGLERRAGLVEVHDGAPELEAQPSRKAVGRHEPVLARDQRIGVVSHSEWDRTGKRPVATLEPDPLCPRRRSAPEHAEEPDRDDEPSSTHVGEDSAFRRPASDPVAGFGEPRDDQEKSEDRADPHGGPRSRRELLARVEAGLPSLDLATALGTHGVGRPHRRVTVRTLVHRVLSSYDRTHPRWSRASALHFRSD